MASATEAAIVPFVARSEPRDRTDAPDLGRARFWADAGVGRFSVLFAFTGVGRSYGRWPASWWDVARRGPGCAAGRPRRFSVRSEEHTSELQSLMRNSYAVFCLTKKTQ